MTPSGRWKSYNERNLKILKYYETHTAEDTAGRFGLSIHSIYSIVHRMKKKGVNIDGTSK